MPWWGAPRLSRSIIGPPARCGELPDRATRHRPSAFPSSISISREIFLTLKRYLARVSVDVDESKREVNARGGTSIRAARLVDGHTTRGSRRASRLPHRMLSGRAYWPCRCVPPARNGARVARFETAVAESRTMLPPSEVRSATPRPRTHRAQQTLEWLESRALPGRR